MTEFTGICVFLATDKAAQTGQQGDEFRELQVSVDFLADVMVPKDR